jgi:exodeoxyribonuclease VII large subunit
VCAKRIGIITSRAGAVIDDFRKNLAERGYVMRMHDARVEGVRAVPSILGAIRWFMQHAEDIDVLVIMRGGGSLEDLQAFNNEQVARAIAALPMPVIAAIGHDRDVPITNMAADHSTSTPSIAALRINQSWEMADQLLARGSERLARGAHSLVLGLQRRVAISGERLVSRSALLLQRVRERASRATLVMQGYLGRAARLPDEHLLRITDAYRASVDRLRERLLAVERELAIVDPQRTLRLGYSILTDATGKAIKSVESLHAGDTVRTRLADGTATSTITHVQPET